MVASAADNTTAPHRPAQMRAVVVWPVLLAVALGGCATKAYRQLASDQDVP
jgi:hypothetical protein